MKFAYIMRGIPGSGKSTVARQIAQQYENTSLSVAIHSTDDLCMIDGEYRFDSALAGERHAQNLENFKGSLAAGTPAVICDNTNIKVAYFAPYVEAAQAAGYAVIFVEVAHPGLDEAVDRNSHGVPREVINQMVLDWEPSQHCFPVAHIDSAHAAVRFMQDKTKGFVAAGFAAGSLVGALIVALAWLISP